jgi:hypothetical protein
MGYYTGRINADRNATRDATMRGLDPEIQATPLAHSLSRGVDMAADEAINGLVPAWAAAEAQMRASSGRALADALGRVQSSNDPWADVTGERAGLDQLAEAQRGALPEFSYSPLAPSQAAYGASAFASPTPDEQAQQARLRRLLASLPQAPATRVVGR